jgi:hypothetical protein
VLSTGPLPPKDAQQYANTYVRGMEEVARFLGVRKDKRQKIG